MPVPRPRSRPSPNTTPTESEPQSAPMDAPSDRVPNGSGIVKRIERIVRRFDRIQQGSPILGFVFGVTKKYGDDRGGLLAAQLAFAGFLSFFPLCS